MHHEWRYGGAGGAGVAELDPRAGGRLCDEGGGDGGERRRDSDRGVGGKGPEGGGAGEFEYGGGRHGDGWIECGAGGWGAGEGFCGNAIGFFEDGILMKWRMGGCLCWLLFATCVEALDDQAIYATCGIYIALARIPSGKDPRQVDDEEISCHQVLTSWNRVHTYGLQNAEITSRPW